MRDDRVTDTVPTACDLVCAVGDRDQQRIHDILTGSDTKELYALAIVLAAMVPDDTNVDVLLARNGLEVVPTAGQRTVREAADIAARYMDVSPHAIFTKSRERPVTDARQVVCWVAADAGFSYSEIGRHIKRDHTSVMHAVSKVTRTPRLYAVANRVSRVLSGLDRAREAV